MDRSSKNLSGSPSFIRSESSALKAVMSRPQWTVWFMIYTLVLQVPVQARYGPVKSVACQSWNEGWSLTPSCTRPGRLALCFTPAPHQKHLLHKSSFHYSDGIWNDCLIQGCTLCSLHHKSHSNNLSGVAQIIFKCHFHKAPVWLWACRLHLELFGSLEDTNVLKNEGSHITKLPLHHMTKCNHQTISTFKASEKFSPIKIRETA